MSVCGCFEEEKDSNILYSFLCLLSFFSAETVSAKILLVFSGE